MKKKANLYDIQIKLHKIILSITNNETTAFNASNRLIEDYDMDSLDMVELPIKLNEQLGVVLDETEWRKIETLDDLAKQCYQKTQNEIF